MKLATADYKDTIQCNRRRSPSAASGFHNSKSLDFKSEWIGHWIVIGFPTDWSTVVSAVSC